ncbi:putative bifunctional diguanylate cyclase/phosphodiesterase [Amphritea pacifica]|uniref:Bifunctional diguanylate cyclase/phosphodiesterase n=1 Tax=Amphritea pacifica TaxID=2811233 RepID=A0ABS2WCB4_9GAMM|nr:bifunctional diguanylate cyclase/phosphodiesterase [Amphritea pacifica]MBN0989002.1 bifunctional diguanylate cyclase/phosphodiesterase [Amphritea pacifica]MBN1009048.1 bifunctional diguanylate cyclase/phosphodiesterase [Amphritea pacifica]
MGQRLTHTAKQAPRKRALLITIVLIFFISAAMSLFQLRQSISLLDENYGTSVFSMFQLKLELRRFNDALALYQVAPDNVHLQQVKTRYDLLWSRFPVLLEGVDGEQITKIDHAKATLSQAFNTVKSLEHDVFKKLATEPEHSLQIQQTLEPQIAEIDALALQNYYQTNTLFNRSESQVIDLQQQLILLMCGLILSGSLLLVMIIRENRLNRYQAKHDSLTGIPNRAFLQNEITRYCRKKQPFALHLIDLNGFKDVNDTLGHHVGDALLEAVSHRLTSGIDKRYGCLTCRLGGDEFAIIQPRLISSDSLGIITGKVIQLFEKRFQIDQHTCFIGASIGSVIFPEHGIDVGSLLTRADIAMYKAKDRATHSSQMLFDFDMDAQIHRRQQLQRDLRIALERSKLHLVYQPIVSLQTQQVVCLETLLRWNHETYGAIPPLEIISIAEKYSLANTLGCWIIDEACRQIDEWRNSGFQPLPVAVNISPSMHQLDLAAIINQSLKQHNLPQGLIRIEVTEDTGMQILKETQDLLPGLARHNISVALDDFGTGLSSLSHLQQLPIQTLKIDRSFISKIGEDQVSRRLVHNIIGIGHDLGMQVVAEGIEDETEVSLLATYQCDYGQGYLFSKPLAPSLIPECCRKIAMTANHSAVTETC